MFHSFRNRRNNKSSSRLERQAAAKIRPTVECLEERCLLSSGLDINAAMLDDAIIDYRNWCVDPYDLFMIRSLSSDGVGFVLTDDKDFVTVPGIQVITLNRSALRAAKACGRLQN